MSNETRAKIVKAAPNRWLVFCILTLSGGIAFKLSSMKDMFYVPMQQFMGLSNTQIGGALSAYGIVQTIGLIAGIYICDMFSKKYMIGGSLIGRIWSHGYFGGGYILAGAVKSHPSVRG